MCGPDVALLAEGVDRNFSRTVWRFLSWAVALLAEGVDRNWNNDHLVIFKLTSPSSRRAWIEIYRLCSTSHSSYVALLAEGVDRNLVELIEGC